MDGTNITNNKDIKKMIIDALYNREGYIKQTQNDKNEYVLRCPYCGDSQKNLNTGHFYIHIDPEDNSPIVYHCFKCDISGILNNSLLDELGISDINLKSAVEKLNKSSDSKEYSKYIKGADFLYFKYNIPKKYSHKKKIQYLEDRLGIEFTKDMLRECKVITSLKDFLLENNIPNVMCRKSEANMIEDCYIGFLSYGSSHIIFRKVDEKAYGYRWIKYPITKNSSKNRIFYSIESLIDIYTKDTIEVNLTEGILDILSVKYNLQHNKDNTINISVCGKGFKTILGYLINLGIVGNNVKVNIFADNDDEFNSKSTNNTDLLFFKKVFSKLKYVYNSVYVYYNKNEKDVGVPLNQIILQKFKL